MLEWIPAIILFIAVVALSNVFLKIFEMFKEHQAASRFEQDFRHAVTQSTPDWSDIKHIASTRDLALADAIRVIKNCHRDILVGGNKELSEERDLIKGYIKRFEEEEPFEGLPTEIRAHLERLRGLLKGNEQLLDPITTHLKETIEISEKRHKQQRRYTVGGFVVGLCGIIVAIFPYVIQNP
ncbi:hypothetical protein M9194_20875 [Vibrio sp. S4M6]|uniref:hypothetical protein n=1 Tax=Vibrio sinus TaxID=2946865 RepID=UPI002029FF83|nr:hypothetical protein [Vibrio sinus]MCL9783880.1 hypothetical protein [Vibrio sinus]